MSAAGRAAALAFIVGAASVGCGDGDPAAGVADLEALPRLTLVEELRIGSQDDPNEGFSSIGGVTVGPDGSVYVMELRDRHIRMYDASGERLRTIGGPGQGPGEFVLRVGSTFGFVGDTLWVNDRSADRVVYFRADGTHLETFIAPAAMMEAIPGVPITLRPAALGRDRLFTTTYSIPGGSMSELANHPTPVIVPVVRLDRSGRIVDTLRFEAFPAPSTLRLTVAGQTIGVSNPPRSDPLYVDRLDGVVAVERPVAVSGDAGWITATRIRGAADTVYERRFSYRPRPYTPERVSSLMEVQLRIWSNRVGEGADTSVAAAAVREALTLPPFQPAVSLARVGDDDVLWLAREDDPSLPIQWVLIGPEGDPLGSLTLPREVTVHWSGGETVWASVLDEVEVPWLVRYRLESFGASAR